MLIEFKWDFLQVSVPKDTLSRLNVKVDVGLPPDAVYNIVTDPDNKRVFKNIKVSDFFLFHFHAFPSWLLVTFISFNIY